MDLRSHRDSRLGYLVEERLYGLCDRRGSATSDETNSVASHYSSQVHGVLVVDEARHHDELRVAPPHSEHLVGRNQIQVNGCADIPL